MNFRFVLVTVLALISMASGYLMSKASWIGKVGMTFFYKEYNLLKIWWQGAIAVFVILLIILSIHELVKRKASRRVATSLVVILLTIGAGGLYLTYDDFTHDFSHHILGRRFHYGFYLAWCGWIVTSLFYLFAKGNRKTIVTISNKTETKGE